jgi:DNA-binding NtrC family response regulator
MSEIKSTHPNVPVILMTDIDVSTAVKAIKTVLQITFQTI